MVAPTYFLEVPGCVGAGGGQEVSRGGGIRELSIAASEEIEAAGHSPGEAVLHKGSPRELMEPLSSTHVRGQGERHLGEQTAPQAQRLIEFTSSGVSQNGKEKLAIHGALG